MWVRIQRFFFSFFNCGPPSPEPQPPDPKPIFKCISWVSGQFGLYRSDSCRNYLHKSSYNCENSRLWFILWLISSKVLFQHYPVPPDHTKTNEVLKAIHVKIDSKHMKCMVLGFSKFFHVFCIECGWFPIPMDGLKVKSCCVPSASLILLHARSAISTGCARASQSNDGGTSSHWHCQISCGAQGLQGPSKGYVP